MKRTVFSLLAAFALCVSAAAAGNTVAELPILAGEDVGHVTFVQMLGRCLARGFCMGSQS